MTFNPCDPCGTQRTFGFSGISLTDDTILEGSEFFNLRINQSTLSPPGVLGASPMLPIKTIEVTGISYVLQKLLFSVNSALI